MSNPMHRFADRYAFALSLVVVFGYFLYFALPAALASNSFGRGETHSDVAAMTQQMGAEVWLALSILVIIIVLGWARAARLTGRPRRRSLWWAVPPVVYMVLLLVVVLAIATGVPSGALPGASGMLALVATVALVAVFEEFLFRGLLFRGLETRMSALSALALSSVIFGLMHYVNWIGGQPLGDTTFQVIHAMTSGLLYGALMLITGSIWPSVMLHALWDGLVSIMTTVSAALPPELVTAATTVDATDAMAAANTDSGPSAQLLLGFEPLYAAVLIAALIVLRRRGTFDFEAGRV